MSRFANSNPVEEELMSRFANSNPVEEDPVLKRRPSRVKTLSMNFNYLPVNFFIIIPAQQQDFTNECDTVASVTL